MGSEMLHETIWFDKHKYDEAEELSQAHLNGIPSTVQESPSRGQSNIKQNVNNYVSQKVNKDASETKGFSTSVKEIAEARKKIQQTLIGAPVGSLSPSVSENRIVQLEAENKELRQKTNDLTEALKTLELRVSQLESSKPATPAPTPAKEEKKQAPKQEKKEDSDSDEDLFGSDSEEEDAEYEKVKQERVAAYQAKKSHKPKVTAKSTITVDVKPWDDETDMAELEKCVRSVVEDGLVWGGSKILPIAYGIQKLQISCVVEDDKVGTELLEERLCAFDEYIQSMDVVAFNKL